MAFETSLRPFFVRMLCNHVEVRLMREATARKPWTPEAEITSGAYCRDCRDGEDADLVLHELDTMCVLDVTDPGVCPSCIVCGVTFGEPCKSCRGRAFHFPGCETPTYDDKRTDEIAARARMPLSDADAAEEWSIDARMAEAAGKEGT